MPPSLFLHYNSSFFKIHTKFYITISNLLKGGEKMKVRVLSSIKKGLTRVFIDLELSKEENKLLYKIIDDNFSDFNSKVMTKIRDTNELGKLIYEKVDYPNYRYFLWDRGEVVVNQDLVTEESLNEIAKAIGERFAEKLTEAIDLPEINEIMVEVTLPDDLANELRRRGVDPTYKCTMSIRKDRGFNDVYVESNVHVASSKLSEAAFTIRKFHNSYFLQLTLPSSQYPHSGIITILPSNNRKDPMRIEIQNFKDIEQQVEKIKEILSAQIQEFRDTNMFNLLITAAYQPLNYSKEIQILNDMPEYTAKVSIKRNWLLDVAKLNIEMKPIPIKRKSYIKLDIDGEGEKVPIEIHPSRDGSILTSDNCFMTDRDIVKSRIDRVLQGDFSVLDEVQQQDNLLTRSIIEQVQQQLPKSIEKVLVKERIDKQIQASVDVLDLIPQDKKDEVIAYFVAEKLKNS
jgi:hypothetical protein